MAVKAVDLVRKIRDKNYDATKDLSVEEQMRVVKELSGKLKKRLKAEEHAARSNAAPTGKKRAA